MALEICTILLREEMRLPVLGIEQELRSRYPELGLSSATEGEGTASFTLKDAELILGNMPAPYPWSDLEGPCSTSILWKDAAEHVKVHKAHIIVTILSELSPVDQYIVLTKGVAAVLAACDAAMGVYWSPATLVVPKNIFIEFTEKVLPEGPPLDIWVDFRVGWRTNTTSAGFTQGMEALGHMEMETEDAREKPSDLRQRLQDLASYLLKNGAVIRDGDSVGQSAEERIRVTYSPSAFGNTRMVMRLNYDTRKDRPWWKVW